MTVKFSIYQEKTSNDLHHIGYIVKRFIDLLLLILTIPLTGTLIIFLIPIMRVSSRGPILFWSDRVGLNNKIFRMPKLRTMKVNAPVIATHLIKNPDELLTPIGAFLRSSSLDELPQLWCVLIGEMSFVGPRPALFNQYDLVNLRTQHGIDKVLPGLTGWAQINGRDEISIPQKVKLDLYYKQKQSVFFDMKIILKTFLNIIIAQDVSH